MKYLSLRIKKGILVFGDILILYFSLFLALKLRFLDKFNVSIWQKHLLPFTIIYIVWLVVFYIFGLYDLSLVKNTADFFKSLIKSLIISGLLAVLLFYLIPFWLGITPKTILFLNLTLLFFLFSIWRYLFNLIAKTSVFSKNLLIIGENKDSEELVEIVNSNPQLGYNLVGVFNPKKEKLKEIDLNKIDILVCALKISDFPGLLRKINQNLDLFEFETLTSFFEKTFKKVPIAGLDESWFVDNIEGSSKRVYRGLKRLIDILIAFILGLIFLLFLPFVALTIKLDSEGPVFYSQKRIGKNNKVFLLHKFRSMKKGAEKGAPVWAKREDKRITRVGKVLRKTLIDELPQFVNILKGEMSFVGPRPERPKFVEKLEEQIPFYQIRHIIEPGLTGWAQVNYRYGNSVKDAKEKLKYELYYIKNRSLFLDFKIILKTIDLIFKGGTQ